MRRRKFIALLAGAGAAPLASARVVRAQQRLTPVIGYLVSTTGSPAFNELRLQAFRQGLGETGFVVGRNVAIEFRSAEGDLSRLPGLAADLVRRQVKVIVAQSDSAALAAKAATQTIPIVFSIGNDPVQHGLVASLNKPGGNLTGTTNLNVELMQKRLEVLHEVVPAAGRIVVLLNPAAANVGGVTRNLQEAANTRGLELHVLHARTEGEIEASFASLARLRADALVIGADGFYNAQSEQLGELAVRHAIPAIFQTREFAAAGGLISYTTSRTENSRQAGVYTGRILKGERPGDLPVQQSTKVELIVNLKTARSLGLTVPLQLLARADEVIE